MLLWHCASKLQLHYDQFDHNSATNSDTLGLADIFICGLDFCIFSFPLLLTKCEQNNDSNNSITIQFYPRVCVTTTENNAVYTVSRHDM